MRTIIFVVAVASLLAVAAGPASLPSSPGDPNVRSSDEISAAQSRVDKAHLKVAGIETDIRNATGRFDVSADGLNKAIDTLQQQQEQLELDEAGSVGRQRATEEAVARFTEEAKKRLDAGDPVVSELEKVVTSREKQLDRMQSLNKTGAIAVESVESAEAALLQAKAEVAAARKNAAGGNGVTEALSAWNREAMNLSIERAEREARLQYIEKRIDSLKKGVAMLDNLDRAMQEERAADGDLTNAKAAASRGNAVFGGNRPTP